MLHVTTVETNDQHVTPLYGKEYRINVIEEANTEKM